MNPGRAVVWNYEPPFYHIGTVDLLKCFHQPHCIIMDSIFQVQGDSKVRLTPLFLIHAISGLGLPYRSLGQIDHRERAVYGINSPIYGARRYRLPSSIDDVARQYIRLVRSKKATGPYLLGGWSFGGLVALKMAEMLRAQGETILQVIMIDTPNPVSRPPWGTERQEALATLTFNDIAQRAEQPTTGIDSIPLKIRDFETKETSDMWHKMYRHIYNVLTLVERAADGELVSEMKDVNVSFVKCTVLEVPPVELITDSSRAFYFQRFEDDYMGWKPERFGKWEGYTLNGGHNRIFDSAHVKDLTVLLRKVVENIFE